MLIFLSVVIILTTLKKPAGHFVASVTPQLVDSWGLAGKHDIISHGYAGWFSSSSDAVLLCFLQCFLMGVLTVLLSQRWFSMIHYLMGTLIGYLRGAVRAW